MLAKNVKQLQENYSCNTNRSINCIAKNKVFLTNLLYCLKIMHKLKKAYKF